MKALTDPPTVERLRLALTGLLLAVAAVILVGAVQAVLFGAPGFDSRFAYLSAADAVLDGRSPYPSLDDPALENDTGYVYTPQLAIAYTPLVSLPVDVATGIAVIATLTAILAALAIVGVRDVRCYAAVLLWAPMVNAVENANVSAALTLALALSWRYRKTVWPLAAVFGLAVSVKLVLWPIFVWAASMRRLRAAALGILFGLAVTAVAWAAIGFAGILDYPRLLFQLSRLQEDRSYSIVGILTSLGFKSQVGHFASLVLGSALLVVCWRFGRRGDDLRAFTSAIAAALVLSPIVWQHYLMFLVVPLALARPRFSAIWLLPIVLWLSPRVGHGEGLQTFLPMAVSLAILIVLLARPRARPLVAEAT